MDGLVEKSEVMRILGATGIECFCEKGVGVYATCGPCRLRDLPVIGPPVEVDVVFDGPPGPVAGRFVDIQDAAGLSTRAGKWVKLEPGRWALRLPAPSGFDREAFVSSVDEQIQAMHRACPCFSDKSPRPERDGLDVDGPSPCGRCELLVRFGEDLATAVRG